MGVPPKDVSKSRPQVAGRCPDLEKRVLADALEGLEGRGNRRGFCGALVAQTIKNLPAGDPGLIPELRRSPGGGYGNPLQNSYLENSMVRGAWRATVHRVAESRT